MNGLPTTSRTAASELIRPCLSPRLSGKMIPLTVCLLKVSCTPEGNAMSEYAREAARRDAERNLLARNMSNATAQEREKYNAEMAAAKRAAANK
jgi:hypothetical protein